MGVGLGKGWGAGGLWKRLGLWIVGEHCEWLSVKSGIWYGLCFFVENKIEIS